MPGKVRSYGGEEVTVTYDVRRCIHAAECVHGLPQVFDTGRKPWVDPDGASAGEVAEVVRRCPTGALHFEREDGGPGEAAAAKNTVTLSEDGPLYARGDLEIVAGDGSFSLRETRAALCRCGASKNKPFCDDSHREVSFAASGAIAEPRLGGGPGPDGEGDGGTLRLTLAPRGPLLVQGRVELLTAGGEVADAGVKGALCRCGGSNNKPYCDGSHARIGFEG